MNVYKNIDKLLISNTSLFNIIKCPICDIQIQTCFIRKHILLCTLKNTDLIVFLWNMKNQNLSKVISIIFGLSTPKFMKLLCRKNEISGSIILKKCYYLHHEFFVCQIAKILYKLKIPPNTPINRRCYDLCFRIMLESEYFADILIDDNKRDELFVNEGISLLLMSVFDLKNIDVSADVKKYNQKGTRKLFKYYKQRHKIMLEINKKCWNCGLKSKYKCIKCGIGRYCSRRCQKIDWKNHKHSINHDIL